MSSGKKKGLGRGLSALFGDEKPKDKPQEINNSNNNITFYGSNSRFSWLVDG